MENNDNVSVYFSKLKVLFDELLNYESISNCTCGGLKSVVEYQQRDWVMKFLMRLNESYKGLKAQIMLIELFLSLNEVYSIIQEEEKCRDISADSQSSKALPLMVKEPNRQFNVPTTNQNRVNYYCSHDKMSGHSLERCFKANPNKLICSRYHISRTQQ